MLRPRRTHSTPTNGLVIIAQVPSSQQDRSMTTLIEVINHGPIRELRLARSRSMRWTPTCAGD